MKKLFLVLAIIPFLVSFVPPDILNLSDAALLPEEMTYSMRVVETLDGDQQEWVYRGIKKGRAGVWFN